MYGGLSILRLLVGDPAYTENWLRQDLWRGHAHAGVLLLLSLIALRYVDETTISSAISSDQPIDVYSTSAAS
jgi:hypothetical protein